MPDQLNDSRSFWDHAEELRLRIAVMAVVWAAGAAACFPFSLAVLRHISRPVGQLVFFAPSEAFSIRVKVSFLVSALVVFPVWVYQGVQFLKEGLQASERRFLVMACVGVSVLSFAGGFFADTVLVPVSAAFLLGFAGGVLEPVITAEHYVAFYFQMMAVCCLAFNLPFVSAGLVWQGVLSTGQMRRFRRHIYIGCFIVSAAITPPDVVTQMMMAVPMCVLYECGVCSAGAAERFKKDRGVL